MTTGDAGKCNALSQAAGAWGRRGLCAALVTGDAAKCPDDGDPTHRAGCTAMVTEDASRCPKTSTDCINMAQRLALVRKDNDPTFAAATQGRQACAPLLAHLQHSCAGSAFLQVN